MNHIIYKEISLFGRSDEIKLAFVGDEHFGAAACDKDALGRTFAEIGDTSNFWWVATGDQFDAIHRLDNRYELESFDPEILKAAKNNIGVFHNEAVDRLATLMRPAAERCIGILDGNHETKLRTRYDIDQTDALLRRLRQHNPGLQRSGYYAVVVLKFTRKGTTGSSRIVIYVHHGVGAPVTKGGRANAALRLRNVMLEADIYACGHYHTADSWPEQTMRIAGDAGNMRFVQRNQWFMLTPSYFRTYDETSENYACRKAYAPSVLGNVLKFSIRPFHELDTRGGGRKTALVPAIRPEWNHVPTVSG
jgi:hypothetical protein